MTGLVLVAHGAQDARWAEPFEAVAARVRAGHPGAAVRLAFLETMTPDIATAAAQLVGAGCRRIVVVPLFLGAGGHVRKDLPARIDTARRLHPGVTFDLAPAVGEDELVIAAMAAAAGRALP